MALSWKSLLLLRSMAIEDLRTRDWILLPGTLCTDEVFTGFLDLIGIPAERRKPVRLRLPAIESYAEVLGPIAGGAVLCGFSLGAIVAAHHADRFSTARTVLFGLNPFPDDPAKATGRRELERDVLAMGGASALSTRLPRLRGPNPDGVRATILAMADIASADIEAQTALALTRPGALGVLSRTRSPVQVMTGSHDDMAPAFQGQAAAQAAPFGRFRDIPNLGHYALLEGPSGCAQAFLELEDEVP
jgi:pimeloyl-ACP methyl ester carboxylesterase